MMFSLFSAIITIKKGTVPFFIEKNERWKKGIGKKGDSPLFSRSEATRQSHQFKLVIQVDKNEALL